MWTWLVKLLMDNLAVPCDVLKDLVDKADMNADGRITMRELYDIYLMWRDRGQ